MKKIMPILIGSSLMLASSVGFSATATDMSNNWICTTNASRASTDADKAADNKMAKTVTSASAAYSKAAKNCRDCTKITCEIKE